MPEQDSIMLQSLIASGFCKNHYFKGFIANRPHDKPIPTIPFKLFSLAFDSRGKQIIVQAKDTNSSNTITFLVGLSIRGFITLIEKEDAIKSRVVDAYFERDDGKVITFNHNESKFLQYITDISVGLERGPDPIRDFDLFCTNVQNSFSKMSTSIAIGAVLLDQKIFNGIGNFLRAEILYHAQIPPFMDVLKLRENKAMMTRLLANCRKIPAEVVEKFIKNGTSHSYYNEELSNWMSKKFLQAHSKYFEIMLRLMEIPKQNEQSYEEKQFGTWESQVNCMMMHMK